MKTGALALLFLPVVICIPGKTDVFHIVDNPQSPWTWVDRLSDRYKFNAAQQQSLHQRLVLNYLRPIPRPPQHTDPLHPLVILLWNIKGFEPFLTNLSAWTQNCPVPCQVTTDKSQLESASMIMNTGLEVPEAFGMLQPHQITALFVLEPDLSLPDATRRMRSYHMLTSYSKHSEVRVDYSRSLRNIPSGRPDIRKKTKKALAAAFISNCESNGDARYRLDYLRELRVHMDIDSYGNCLHTSGLDSHANLTETANQYYFILVFENSMLDDYVTDKFYEALGTDAIPVYLGAPNIADYLPDQHNSRIIIETRHYADPANLASYLKKLAANEEEYLQYFEWRDRPIDQAFSKKLDFEAMGPDSFVCRMCQYYDTHVEK